MTIRMIQRMLMRCFLQVEVAFSFPADRISKHVDPTIEAALTRAETATQTEWREISVLVMLLVIILILAIGGGLILSKFLFLLLFLLLLLFLVRGRF